MKISFTAFNCAEPAHRLHLDARRRLRHHDDGAKAERAAGVGDPLGVIAGARRDDAAGAFLTAQAGDLVVCAAQLEAEDRLQVLALEQHPVTEAARETSGKVERRFAGDVVDAAGEDVVEERGEARAHALSVLNGSGVGSVNRRWCGT